MERKYGGVPKMEYRKNKNSWQASLANGNIDEALGLIQLQIATNLMDVHNMFCKDKYTNPEQVLAYRTYGKKCSDAARERIAEIVDLDYMFCETTISIDFESTESKEAAIKDFQMIEKRLEEEISKI